MKSTEPERSAHDHAEYICPMKCEGSNVHHESGACPECGMEMVTVEEMKRIEGEKNN